MHRRQFIKKVGLVFGGIPFWSGVLVDDLAAKLPENIKITDVKCWGVGIEGNQVFMRSLATRSSS